MRPLHWINHSVIDAYLRVSLDLGLGLSRHAGKNSTSHVLGCRSAPWWINGVSPAATRFASATPVAATETVRGLGIQRLWWLFAGGIAQVGALSAYRWFRREAASLAH